MKTKAASQSKYILSRNALLGLIDKDEVDTVALVFPDMQGRWMGKRITGSFFAKEAAKHGTHACAYLLTVDMEMEPWPGFQLTSWEKGYQDFHMVPDWNTARLLPWLEKTALIVCDLLNDHGEPIEVSPRAILKKQIEKAKKLGLSFMCASELEFFLFNETYETARQKNYHNLNHFGHYLEDYHILQGTKEEIVHRTIRNFMEQAGVPVECSKGEWGPGQHEINLRYSDALNMADRHTVYKHGAKEIAISKGFSITFMAKHDSKLAGSSFHLHSSAWDLSNKTSKFWSDGKPSKLFWNYLGGQMKLARDFSLFYAPSVNSYKRYQASSFAPTKIAWGQDNRTCGFRLVGHDQSFRVENRIPGADANPYLAFAATIAAGLHGIKNKIEPPKEFKGDAYHAKEIVQVPQSLGEAIEAFEKSPVAPEALGEKVFEHYLHAAKMERQTFEKAVTCWERERYFERI